MVAEELIASIPQELGGEINILIKTLQALGGVIFLYLIFGVINALINRKKSKELKKINNNIEEIKKILKRKK